MPAQITKQEILDFLHQIEEGVVTLKATHEPQDVYAGNVQYVASNGWKIVVFNDCNEWDYIDFIETPDGRQIDYETLSEDPELDAYEPPADVAWTRYGIPGYVKCRCTKCGVEISGKTAQGYLCSTCATTG